MYFDHPKKMFWECFFGPTWLPINPDEQVCTPACMKLMPGRTNRCTFLKNNHNPQRMQMQPIIFKTEPLAHESIHRGCYSTSKTAHSPLTVSAIAEAFSAAMTLPHRDFPWAFLHTHLFLLTPPPSFLQFFS